MNIKPLSDRIIVKPYQAVRRTDSGVIVPVEDSSAENQLLTGEVVAVGPGREDSEGNIKAMTVKEGDTVAYYGGYYGKEFQWEGIRYLMMSEYDIAGIVTKSKD